jgi:hypothetical protein
MKVIKSERMQWAYHIVHMGEMRNAFIILVGNPERKRPLRRPKCRQDVYNGS